MNWLIKSLDQFLSSKTGLFLALVVPLVVIPMPASVQRLENILSSNWTQLWALFVLGIMAKNQSQKHDELHAKVKLLHKHVKEVHSKVHDGKA